MAGSQASNPWRKARKSGELPSSNPVENLDEFTGICFEAFQMKNTSKGASAMDQMFLSRDPAP